MKSILPGGYDDRMEETVIGVIPAAGFARRLPGLAGSKELLPLPSHLRTDEQQVLADRLLACYAAGDIRRALVLTRQGKEDLRTALGTGSRLGVELSYLDVGRTDSVLETICKGLPSLAGRSIALGFPDVLFEPADAFSSLWDRLQREGADVVLGVFPVVEPARSDMVEVDSHERVTRVRVKDPEASPGFGWMIALWRPEFSPFMNSWFEQEKKSAKRELYPGDVFQAAVSQGVHIASVRFPRGRCLDVGTPAGLAAARGFSAEPLS